jgi:hypothetical protein
MQALLLNWLALCWNIALVLLMTLLILTPLWSPAFDIACCVAMVWPACFMYVILAARSNAKLRRMGGKQGEADANKRARGTTNIPD